MQRTMLAAAALALPALVLAKLPAPQLDDAAKAKAAEAAAKTAWQAKVDAFQLCKAQDRVAAAYRKSGTAPNVQVAAVQPTAAGSAAAAPAAKAPEPKPTATNPGAAAPKRAASGPSASEGGGTPVKDVGTAAVVIPPCADPGPFAYNAPSQTPLETSGAHSPAGTAVSPPSVNQHSADMKPAASGKK